MLLRFTALLSRFLALFGLGRERDFGFWSKCKFCNSYILFIYIICLQVHWMRCTYRGNRSFYFHSYWIIFTIFSWIIIICHYKYFLKITLSSTRNEKRLCTELNSVKSATVALPTGSRMQSLLCLQNYLGWVYLTYSRSISSQACFIDELGIAIEILFSFWVRSALQIIWVYLLKYFSSLQFCIRVMNI